MAKMGFFGMKIYHLATLSPTPKNKLKLTPGRNEIDVGDADGQTPAEDRTTSVISTRFYEAFRRLISPNGIARVTIFISMVVRTRTSQAVEKKLTKLRPNSIKYLCSEYRCRQTTPPWQ
jgi:hypothetical protein